MTSVNVAVNPPTATATAEMPSMRIFIRTHL